MGKVTMLLIKSGGQHIINTIIPIFKIEQDIFLCNISGHEFLVFVPFKD